jgi:hypothetical protein
MTEELWSQILEDADHNQDGKIDYNEFESAMKDVFRKSWLRKCDQSPSKSISPVRSFKGMEMSPVKYVENIEYGSPIKRGSRQTIG